MASIELGNRYLKARTTLDYGQFIVPVSTYIISVTYENTSMVYLLMIPLSVVESLFSCFSLVLET